jgi:processive 1,2-diacylglycerol beta-glucosyltransferase
MKLWILSASTGGGHDMRAYALKDWWEERGGEAEVYHPLENSFWAYRLGCHFYNVIQKKCPRFHFLYFFLLEILSMHRKAEFIFGKRRFTAALNRFSPHLVVSTHAHLNHGFFEIIRKESNSVNPKFIIYCGELADGIGYSRNWINSQVDLFASPYEEGCKAAQGRGIPKEKCFAVGPLLRKPFYQTNDHYDKVRLKYKLQESLPVYLLGTGANGVNQHLAIIRAFKKAAICAQIVALCGDGVGTLLKLKREGSSGNLRLITLPKVGADEMVALLKISNWIFARPGAGLTTEAIVSGCPIIFDTSRGIMPQEYNSLNFWKKHAKEVISCTSARELVDVVLSKRKIPKVHFPVGDSPQIFLDKIEELIK